MIGLVEVGRYRKLILPVDDISAVLSKAVRQTASSLLNVHCRWTFGARQTINHVFRNAGKMSRDMMLTCPLGVIIFFYDELTWVHVLQTVQLQGKVPPFRLPSRINDCRELFSFASLDSVSET